MKIKQSETVIIKRSQINFAPYNPRKKDAKVVEKLKRNFKKVGFLGGIVWNEASGNLVGGHKRIEAMDVIYNYPEVDYDVKVEKINVDDKTEKEQNIFLNSKSAQGQMDFEIIAALLPEIDYNDAGLTDYDVNLAKSLSSAFHGNNTDIIKDIDVFTKKEPKESKQEIRNKRSAMKKDKTEDRLPFYFTVTFDSYMQKAEFLENIGINGDETMITGETLIDKLQS